jgi:hypothetical protein
MRLKRCLGLFAVLEALSGLVLSCPPLAVFLLARDFVFDIVCDFEAEGRDWRDILLDLLESDFAIPLSACFRAVQVMKW